METKRREVPGVLVLDIEGTTTSISFVYDVMFPYVRRELAAFLDTHLPDGLREEVTLLREQSAQDKAAGLEGVPEISGEGEALKASLLRNVLWQMDSDRKTTGLKALQGKIWKAGFASGELKGHVYDDVPEALKRFQAAGVPVMIYSSGSVSAQKLLFGHSVAGDLLPYLSGHFDTKIGSKKEASSYRLIADTAGLKPASMLFVTDSLVEAVAAREAGVNAILSIRPGNPELPIHDFKTIEGLLELI